MTRLYRIIYVTGMKPKPPAEEHKRALLRALAAGLERVLPAAAERLEAERFTMVSWTRLLYGITRDIRPDLPGLKRLLAAPVADAAERRELDSPRRRLIRAWHVVGDSFPALTPFMARPALQATLADVRRYLCDENGVGVGIREVLRAALTEAWGNRERVLLIGHSLGSVIAYDCLWELSRTAGAAGRVERFVTLGSPLATRFIRRALKGADRAPPERWPANIGRWTNFAARGEMVALHPRLEPFFGGMVEHGLVEAIEDHTDLYNHFHGETGIDPHKSYGYLIHADVAGLIGGWMLEA